MHNAGWLLVLTQKWSISEGWPLSGRTHFFFSLCLCPSHSHLYAEEPNTPLWLLPLSQAILGWGYPGHRVGSAKFSRPQYAEVKSSVFVMQIINIHRWFFHGCSDPSSLFCVSAVILEWILPFWTSRNNPELILTSAKEVLLRWWSWTRGPWRGSRSQGSTAGQLREERAASGTTIHQRQKVEPATLFPLPSTSHTHSLFSETNMRANRKAPIIVVIISKQQVSRPKQI